MSSSDLAQAPSPHILDIESDRPLCPLLVADVNAFCDRLEDTGGTTSAVIRLSGTGPAENWPGDVGIDVVSRWEKALRRLEQGRFAKIVTVEGVCSGPALDMLLTADHRIGAPGLRIAVPVNNDGVWAGMALHRLTNQLGGLHARRLVLFGAELSEQRALAMGLIDQTAKDPAAVAARLAERFARLDPAELAIRRQLVLEAGVTAFEEALGKHLAACDRTLRRTRGEFAGARGNA
ncbi:enoyl-CoA hydratase-related protein [Streptomyces phaeoluteigriseus]|uniref:Enoyl-CoA hydratase-related protein n=1 Tax=Streptomyces phaeoluteigriseus TaxID=114686 RepID=A0ABY4Z9I2_9ACTN|nr:enoyl-CoA-hydratase DpgB [Streptomyces phaeoluteigriseus]USQ85708.1 enoyl-CoA hydratase-related protein [Streptomyces phaeoluteigriseus]